MGRGAACVRPWASWDGSSDRAARRACLASSPPSAQALVVGAAARSRAVVVESGTARPVRDRCRRRSALHGTPAPRRVAGTLTPRHSRASLPSPSMTNVLRSMPRTFLPYMFFILMTSNCAQSFSSASESSSNGNSIFALKLSCDFSESRETPTTTAPSFAKLLVQVAEMRAFGRAAGRVVLRVEVQDDRMRPCASDSLNVAAGGGGGEVGDFLARVID